MPVPSPKPSNVVAFPEHAVDILEAYLRGLPSLASRRVYAQVMRDFAIWVSPADVLRVSRRQIEAYRTHLEELGRAATTIAKHMAAISGYLGYAADEGVIEKNAAARARRPKIVEAPVKHGLTPSEVASLLEVCDTATAIGCRDRALVLVLAVQALRISEALDLTVESISEEDGRRVAQILGKGAKTAPIPLAPEVYAAVADWCEMARIDDGPIFVAVRKGGCVVPGKAICQQSAWKRIRYLAAPAGIRRKVHPHLFRHGCATAALVANVPLHIVQDHLRHADPRTTRRYDANRKSMSNPTGPTIAALIDGAGS